MAFKNYLRNKISIAGSVSMGLLMYGEKVLASVPTTGIPEVDKPGWILTTRAQSVIFWVTMLFSLKALLEFAIKRDKQSLKEFFIGFLIIACDYLVPWGYIAIKNLCTGN